MGSHFPAFQVISVIRPPGLPAEKADRRIWWLAICGGLYMINGIFSNFAAFISS